MNRRVSLLILALSLVLAGCGGTRHRIIAPVISGNNPAVQTDSSGSENSANSNTTTATPVPTQVPVEQQSAPPAPASGTPVPQKMRDLGAPPKVGSSGIICPIALGEYGQIVLTQGYDGHTHTPTDVWGGLDFAIDIEPDNVPNWNASMGAQIVAPEAGTITLVLRDAWPAGNGIQMVGDSGRRYTLAHFSTISVEHGQRVQQGDPVGTMGMTGNTSGPHLHIEVWVNGVNTNPYDALMEVCDFKIAVPAPNGQIQY